MKIHDKMSEELEECTDLRQGSALSPVLFSLYINDLVKRLHAEKCGVHSVVIICFPGSCLLMIHIWLPLTKQG